MTDRDLTAVLHLVERLQRSLAQSDRANFIEVLRQLVALRAHMGHQWQSLAQIAADFGELALLREAIDLFVEASGGTDAARYQKAALFAHSGAWQAAYDLLETLPGDVPDRVANTYSRGISLLNLGEAGRAREHLEQVVEMRPQAGSAWLALTMSLDLASEPDLARRIEAAAPGMEATSPAERAPYYYALGKARADRGDHGAAFAAFARGAEEAKVIAAYDSGRDRGSAADAVRGYSAESIAALSAQQGEPTKRTIFVMGLPRSGTTLVEQILTGHSTVGGGAETNHLVLLGNDVGGQSFPVLARYVGTHGAAAAARLWHHWLDERFPVESRIVDKSVITSRYLGLAAALLPEAPLVWVTRDPLDRAWSCFRTNFLGNAMPWSYDLRDIAAHFRLEDRLMAQWREILGDRLLEVPYEALVGDPQAWTRRLLAHCGLREEPQVFTPHENRRAVATASMIQVRKPINAAAVGAAEPYREFLQPFIDAYYA